jgi:hypothetical protein
MNKIVLFILFLLVFGGAGSASPPKGQVYPSPDGAVTARISQLSASCAESFIEVRTAKGHLLLHKSYGSPDCDHGMGINRGAWTADSKFFVFNAQASGGHQPWHWPVYFYNRSVNSLRVLDNYIGPIVAPDFTIKPQHIIETRVLEMQNDRGKPISVDLMRLRSVKRQ